MRRNSSLKYLHRRAPKYLHGRSQTPVQRRQMLSFGCWKAALGCTWPRIGRSSLYIHSWSELHMRQPAANIAPRGELAFAEGHCSQGNVLARQGSVWPRLLLLLRPPPPRGDFIRTNHLRPKPGKSTRPQGTEIPSWLAPNHYRTVQNDVFLRTACCLLAY